MRKAEQVVYLTSLLKRIAQIGYASRAHLATEAVLACVRLAEEGILEVERKPKRRGLTTRSV